MKGSYLSHKAFYVQNGLFEVIAYTKKICNLIGWDEYNIGRICTQFSIIVLWLNKKKYNIRNP